MSPADIRPLDVQGEMRAAHEHETADSAPMLLTLIDAREDAPPAGADADRTTDAAGVLYAELVGLYTEELVPWARDDDQGALITVLKTIGFTAFDAPRAGGRSGE